MHISLNWLNELLDLNNYSLNEIDDLLTFAGIEVEDIESKGVPSEKIVVAQIKEVTQHPNADRLKICQVDAGEETLRQIVCGARNYQIGDKVPCALPGSDLGGDFIIKEGKLRGVESNGMLCGADEIGLTDEEDGLMILPIDSPIGTKLIDLFDSDTLIEVEITPNRPDLLSHTGMARELAALTGKAFIPKEIEKEAILDGSDLIHLEDVSCCPYYTATKITGIQIGESPTWLREKIKVSGQCSVNTAVDITNYVLHQLGQPLHAFDADKVQGKLVIRYAEEGEKFIPLIGEETTLRACDLIISDDSQTPLALAGIMGGLHSGVTEETTTILLESAYFNPSEIRKTSRETHLCSDSSYRFERGVDPQGVIKGASLAIDLFKNLCGGSVEQGIKETGDLETKLLSVKLNPDKLFQLMGDNITLEQSEAILSKLGLKKAEDSAWIIPSYRVDLTRHIDLVEEIARVHGLDKIEPHFQSTFSEESLIDQRYDFEMNLKRQLAAQGLFEAQTLKLIAENSSNNLVANMQDGLPLKPLLDGDLIHISLPLSEDQTILRPSIIPGLISVAARNIRQGVKTFTFFEFGRCFRNAGGGKAKDLESEHLGILLGGRKTSEHWSSKQLDTFDLYDLKGLIAALVPQHSILIKKRTRANFILSADILIAGKNIGSLAQISPARCRTIDSDSPIFVAELDLTALFKLTVIERRVTALPQFPSSCRDASMEVPFNLEVATIDTAISKHNENLLVDVQCLDFFADPSGEKIDTDKKSLTYRFTYRNNKKTLKAKEVDTAHAALLDHLTKNTPVRFR